MRKNFFFLLFILIMTSACGSIQSHSADSAAFRRSPAANNPYLQQIVNWQRRVAKEKICNPSHKQLSAWKNSVANIGWKKEIVRQIIQESKALTSYAMEIEDTWDTPGEFIANAYQGDCEDIAIFIMANLHRLEYPYPVRVLAVKTNFEDHALVKVQMPDRTWEVFETVPTSTSRQARLVYTPIVEFDERDIISHITTL